MNRLRVYRHIQAFPLDDASLSLSSWATLHALYKYLHEGPESAISSFLLHLMEISDIIRHPDYQRETDRTLEDSGREWLRLLDIGESWMTYLQMERDLQREYEDLRSLWEGKDSWIYKRLIRVMRYSGTPLVTPDNLADHIFETILIALKHKPDRISPVDVFSKALIHDLDEIITGDVPRPLKYGLPGMKEFLEEQSHSKMASLFSPTVYQIWRESKRGISGKIVLLSDLVSVLVEQTEEILLGSKWIIYNTAQLPDLLHKVSKDFEEDRYPYKNHLVSASRAYAQISLDLMKGAGWDESGADRTSVVR